MDLQDRIELDVGTIAVIFEPVQSHPINVESIAGFMRRPLTMGQTVEGLTVISSSRGQIDAQLASNKLDVRGTSGEIQNIAQKVPKVLEPFLEIIGVLNIKTYGINFILDVSSSDPGALSALLNPTLAKLFGAPVAGNGVALTYAKDSKSMTLRLDARSDSILRVNFNASETAASLPSEKQLGEELESQYAILLKLLEDLEV